MIDKALLEAKRAEYIKQSNELRQQLERLQGAIIALNQLLALEEQEGPNDEADRT